MLDRKTKEWIRQKIKLIDIAEQVARQKWKWDGHLMRVDDNRWTKKTTEWRPRTTKRNPGRPRWNPETGRYPVDESDNQQKWFATNWRGLCPEMGGVKLKMMMMMIVWITPIKLNLQIFNAFILTYPATVPICPTTRFKSLDPVQRQTGLTILLNWIGSANTTKAMSALADSAS